MPRHSAFREGYSAAARPNQARPQHSLLTNTSLEHSLPPFAQQEAAPLVAMGKQMSLSKGAQGHEGHIAHPPPAANMALR